MPVPGGDKLAYLPLELLLALLQHPYLVEELIRLHRRPRDHTTVGSNQMVDIRLFWEICATKEKEKKKEKRRKRRPQMAPFIGRRIWRNSLPGGYGY